MKLNNMITLLLINNYNYVLYTITYFAKARYCYTLVGIVHKIMFVGIIINFKICFADW